MHDNVKVNTNIIYSYETHIMIHEHTLYDGLQPKGLKCAT